MIVLPSAQFLDHFLRMERADPIAFSADKPKTSHRCASLGDTIVDMVRVEMDLAGGFDRVGALLLPITAVMMLPALLPLGASAYDMNTAFVPWMAAVKRGGLGAISGEFANYTPPYIYLMYLSSKLFANASLLSAVKLICLPFVVLSSLTIYKIVLQSRGDRSSGLIAGCSLFALPTVIINAFIWGQTDIIFTSFLLLFVYHAGRNTQLRAALMFGIAISFKLQAMFLAPFLLYLVLSGQMRLWTLLAIPAAYVAMMLPAAVAGRPWNELLGIYVGQGETFRVLSMHAPNPWSLVERFELINYGTGTVIGLAVAACVGLLIAIGALRAGVSPTNNLLVATLCAVAMPYVLPKMHDRYFFIGDIMTLVLAFTLPRYWIVAVLLQFGSLAVYLDYFNIAHRGQFVGIVPMTVALGILAWALSASETVNRVNLTFVLGRLRDALRLAPDRDAPNGQLTRA